MTQKQDIFIVCSVSISISTTALTKNLILGRLVTFCLDVQGPWPLSSYMMSTAAVNQVLEVLRLTEASDLELLYFL